MGRLVVGGKEVEPASLSLDSNVSAVGSIGEDWRKLWLLLGRGLVEGEWGDFDDSPGVWRL